MKLFKRPIELVVIRDIFNPVNNIELYQGHDVEALLKQAFTSESLSQNIKLYHNDLTNDVTPKSRSDVDKLLRLDGRIYAVVRPMGFDPFTLALIISVGVSVAVSFLMPTAVIPSVVANNVGSNSPPSPNNSLAQRTNKQRLGGRVPDIYGEVLSVPDLIAETYSLFDDHKEIEMAYLCIGRGSYFGANAMDNTTPINEIKGSSVKIYDPNQDINTPAAYSFGDEISDNQLSLSRYLTKRYTAVNGQTLSVTDNYVNDIVSFTGRTIEMYKDWPEKVHSDANFTELFKVGDMLLIEGCGNLKGWFWYEDGNVYNLNGRFEIGSLTSTSITLKEPEKNNPNWAYFLREAGFGGTWTRGAPYEKGVLSVQTDSLWQGWFYTNSKEHDTAFYNITASNGVYISKPSGKWTAIGVKIIIESELVDDNNQPIPATFHSQNVVLKSPDSDEMIFTEKSGNYLLASAEVTNSRVRSTASKTVFVENPFFFKGAKLRSRIARASEQIIIDGNTTVDEVKIRDFYGARKITYQDMPKNVTTVYSKSLATEGALAVKERQLKLLVQRYVKDSMTGQPVLSNRADDIIYTIATDETIGNLSDNQIDTPQIKSEVDQIISYFGTEKCAEFCHTFDENNLSAEETIQTVAKAIFSQAKRQGNKIRLDFERIVPASVAIFNSHNILPDTYSAPQSFGIINDYDGVKVEYTDPIDDAVVTLTHPSQRLINPHQDKLAGVRNKVQAHMHLMRIYNRDLFTYKSCEFTAGDESNIVVRTNRITVAEQLRADIQQGSVDSIETVGSEIILNTSDPVLLDAVSDYTAFIQTTNNGVEAIAVTANDDYSVKLARLPSGEISAGYDSVVQAVYQIVSNDDIKRDAYLVAEKSPADGMTNKLICTNYDDRYYQADSDFKNNLIPSEVL